MLLVRGDKMPEKLFAGLTYNQTVQKYSHTVAGVCVMRLQNYADAEDCYQNVFMKLFAQSPQFSNEDHLKAWLIRVAINECKLLLRDNRRMIPLDSLKGRAIQFSEDSGDMSWALLKTPQKYRVVLYLYYCEQYKVREIADILKISESAVKARLTRGREKLKEIYGGD